MGKEWKIFAAESCPNCGDNLEVLSGSPESNDTEFEQYFSDGEEVRCCAKCGFESVISVDDGEAWIQDGNIDELIDNEDANENIINKDAINIKDFEQIKVAGTIVNYEIDDNGVKIIKEFDLRSVSF